ncbi:sodium:solute symporter family transporter [Pontiella desulfatans]|nr:transporter [Pontiella desulfatans]
MTIYDYIVIGVYLVFMLSLGPIYKSFSKTASDFFRGGGGMLWWVVGSSAFMTTFSAWSFTGGAAKAYETGTYFLILFVCNIVALLFCFFLTAAKFRQMRVVTAVEGIRKRYGPVSEQVYTWLPLVFQTFMGGVMLYTISVFMSGVFGLPMGGIIVVMAVVVIVMTLLGGSWAATAGDFVQMLVVLTITISMALLTLKHEQIGGFGGLMRNVPDYHFEWTALARPWVIVAFAVTLMINQVTMMNSMLTGAARYLFVKDGKDARKAVLISIAGFLLLAPVWMIPAMGSAVIFPDLSGLEQFSQLNNANEAAYVAIAMELLPQGLLGLLVCGIFAASLTSMNSLLNVYSGTFVRNFYIRVINKEASELKQIFVGRVFILIYGLIWMLVALCFKDMKEIKLFDLILKATAMIGLPTAMPLTYGMFFKKTPEWAGWGTMVGGFIMAAIAKFGFTHEWMQGIWGQEAALSKYELADLNLALTTGSIFIVCNIIYFASMLFHKNVKPEYSERVEAFFEELNTPIDRSKDHEPDYESDKRQYSVLGNLCLAYGLLTLLLLAVPNEMRDRLLILACGGFVVLVGVILRAASLKTKRTV